MRDGLRSPLLCIVTVSWAFGAACSDSPKSKNDASIASTGDAAHAHDAGRESDASGPDATPSDAGGADSEPRLDGGTSDAEALDAGPFLARPIIRRIIPQVLVAGGTVYIHGENLGDQAHRREVGVQVRPRNEDAGVPLVVTSISGQTLTATVPSDLGGLSGRVEIVVTTPAGTVTSSVPLNVVPTSNGFGGSTQPGDGLLGLVYQLQPGTSLLPNFENPCAEPSVINDPPATPCPFSSLLVPNLAVGLREFSNGFPGVSDALVEWFAIEFSGKLHADQSGDYNFRVCSDDGSKIYIDGVMLVNNDGVHASSCALGQRTLAQGEHDIRVEYFQGPRYQIQLEVYWTPPGGTEALIPPTALSLDPRGL